MDCYYCGEDVDAYGTTDNGVMRMMCPDCGLVEVRGWDRMDETSRFIEE